MSNHDLAKKFREAADYLERRDRVLQVQDVKFFLLAMLNDIDRAQSYGNPGKGIDDLLGKETGQ